MGHSHSHSHLSSAADMTGPAAGERRLWPMVVGVVIIGTLFVVELVTGILINSLALIAEAGHMLTDVVALLMGLSALQLARHGKKTSTRSFGWHRAEVFTAVANAVLLYGIAAFVVYEAVTRMGEQTDVPGLPLILVALLGLAANVVVMLLLRVDARASIAIRGAYMEVLADAVSSVAVLVAGVVTVTTGWSYADIAAALFIAVLVVPRATKLALDGLRILNQQAPASVDVSELRHELADLPQVDDVHDLHVWSLTTGMDVATVHLGSARDNSEVLAAAREVLSRHGLDHATIQVDPIEVQKRCREELHW